MTIENNKYNNDIIVMCGEPSPNLTIEKVNDLFEKIETEKDIADLYAETRHGKGLEGLLKRYFK